MKSKNYTEIKKITMMEKFEQTKTLGGVTESTCSWEGINSPLVKESKYKVKSSEGSDMDIDQPEQLDAPLSQSVRVLNKTDTE